MSKPSQTSPGASEPGLTRRLLERAAAGVLLGALAAAVGVAAAPAQSFDIVAEHNRRALALVNRGELDGAVSEWREALRVAPENVPILLNLGIILVKLSRAAEAEEILQKAVGLDPQRASAHLHLGRAYLRQGKTQLAEAELSTAQQLDPIDDAIDVAFAVLAMRQSRWQAAEAHLKRALTFRHNNPTTHAALGDVYRAMGEWSKAEQAYRTALSFNALHRGAKRGLGALKREKRRGLVATEVGRSTGILRVEDPVTLIEKDQFVVEGQVINTSDRATAAYVTVVCKFYDTEQRLIAEKETHTKPEHLGPGERGTWRLSVANSPNLARHFDIGVKAIVEDPEAEKALREASGTGAGPSPIRRPTFFGGDEVEPDDVLKVSIPKPVTEEGKPILRGFVLNVGDHPVASIDLIIGLVERPSGRLYDQRFARIDRQILKPGERADYIIELPEGIDPRRIRPTMKVSWADLPASEAEPPSAPSRRPEAAPAKGLTPRSRLPTTIPEPLHTRPRN